MATVGGGELVIGIERLGRLLAHRHKTKLAIIVGRVCHWSNAAAIARPVREENSLPQLLRTVNYSGTNLNNVRQALV